MVTIAQGAANWRSTHTHVDRTHSLTHLHQHSYNNHVVRSAFVIDFYFEDIGGKGDKPEYPEKVPNSLPANIRGDSPQQPAR